MEVSKEKPVQQWTIEEVVIWAAKFIETENASKLKGQEVDGKALLNLNVASLERCGIPVGPASILAKEIEKLRGPTKQDEATIVPDFSSPRVKKSTLSHLLEKNRAWSDRIKEKNPNFFYSLSQQQTPELLWIGCADSRVPANEIVNLQPGEVFVHRNIANVVLHTDLNCLSVLQYAVEVLKVKHVIVCGHYGCGGVKAALSHQQYGLIDNWLRNIKDVYMRHRLQLEAVQNLSETSQWDLLTELNVLNSVQVVCRTTIVQNAWSRGQQLSVHGWCYRLTDGYIRDLGVVITNPTEIDDIYRVALEKKQANQ
jgi:carbonic anhydrase